MHYIACVIAIVEDEDSAYAIIAECVKDIKA